MDTPIAWIMIAIVILLILGLIVAIISYKKKGKHEPDYRTFFTMGIIWLVFGIPMMIQDKGSSTFFILGLVFTAVGLLHKDKWKKPESLPKDKKSLIYVLLAAGIALMFALIGVYVYLK